VNPLTAAWLAFAAGLATGLVVGAAGDHTTEREGVTPTMTTTTPVDPTDPASPEAPKRAGLVRTLVVVGLVWWLKRRRRT
jgi:hypothetical protein